MIPDFVSMSCDSNPYYLEFWEPVSRMWARMGVHPHLFFIGDREAAPLNEHGTVTVVEPVKGIPCHTQAQWARFFFTKTRPDKLWITSDIDMFPLSRKHFVDSVNHISNDMWLNTNSDEDYFPVCYNYAMGHMYERVLDLPDSFAESVNRVTNFSKSFDHVVNGKVLSNWAIDENYLSHKVCKFRSAHSDRVLQVRTTDRNQRRVDRSGWRYDVEKVKSQWYWDSHSLRPYPQYKNEIESLLALVP